MDICIPSVVLSARRYASTGTNYGPVSVCVSVCLSAFVPSLCSVEVAGRIELVFGTEASSDLYYTVF